MPASAKSLPPVLVTCGEPAGIGPEIAVAAWQALGAETPFVWIGDPRHLPAGTPIAEISDPQECDPEAGFPVLVHELPGASRPGAPDAKAASGVIDIIARAVTLVQDGKGCALCTAPVHKQVLIEGAGFAYPGHTEYLAALAGEDVRAVMMIAGPSLRVVPVTIHCALEDVPHRLTPALLRETLEITAAALRRDFGIARPRLAVAGLNPHAGEGGLMGRQEVDWIAPLLDEMRAEGHDILGPLPADTMFHDRARADYDVALGMYHDQVLVPVKTLDFDRGVNVTLGLPFARTSPDHGTAFDIAGRGIATPQSMIEAIRLAHTMGAARADRTGS